jgi:hypothetical protein
MADMTMFATGSDWFCLIVGVALFVEVAALLVVRRRPGGGKGGPRGDQVPTLLSIGVALVSGSASRLVGLTGAPMTAATVVGLAGAVATLVFATRSLRMLRRAAPPSQEQEQEQEREPEPGQTQQQMQEHAATGNSTSG